MLSGSHRTPAAAPRSMLGPCPEPWGADHRIKTVRRGYGEDDAMSPNLTVGYMAEQINRERLDGIASRGWLAEEAAATRPRAARPAQVPAMLGTALMRLGERVPRMSQTNEKLADPVALLAR